MFDTEIHNFHTMLNTQVLCIIDPLKKADAGIEIANNSLSKLKELVEQEDFENVPV